MRPALEEIALPARYAPLRHLADGGMASVWAARDRVLGRNVAVKLLSAALAEDPRAVRRFEGEARAAAGLAGHRNVVTIYDIGQHEELPFIVMELMPGGTVADALRAAGGVSHRRALRWLRQAARGLDAAHAHGVVHRDVKPGNLLLGRGGERLAVGDFGIARVAEDGGLTRTGRVLGTVGYLAPEQLAGEAATAASDRYALAVLADELLRSRRSGLAADAEAVLARGTDPDPGRRWSSATAFAEALEGALGRAEARRRVAPPRARRPGGRPRQRPGRRRSARRRILTRVVSGLVLAGALTAAFASSGTERAAAPPDAQASTPAPRHAHARARAARLAQRSPTQLNDRGYRLILAGHPRAAVPYLRAAVHDYARGSTDLTYGYALFNLAHALRLSGHPQRAIPLLRRRLRIADQIPTVRAELHAARAEAAGGTRS